jgi:ribosomal protein S25
LVYTPTKKINTLKIHNYLLQIMEGAESAKLNHQRNKSEIVNLVKDMFSQDKWGDSEYKEKLQELVTKDEELVQEVIKKIKQEKGIE